MRGRPIGTVISSVSLGVLMVGAFVFALVLVATSRNIANTGLMGPFGVALIVIAFGFSALFAAIALWQLESWAWPFAMVVGLVGLLGSIIALVASRHLLLLVGVALTAAVVVSLLPGSMRRMYRVRSWALRRRAG
jgi:hypothetical protein